MNLVNMQYKRMSWGRSYCQKMSDGITYKYTMLLMHMKSCFPTNWFSLHFSAEKCCNFPACYDSIYNLCIDTCRPKGKCGSNVDPREGSTVWVPCPIRLSLPDCNSKILSPLGKLPLECYPDIPEILPVSFLARTGQTISSYFRVRILKPFFYFILFLSF